MCRASRLRRCERHTSVAPVQDDTKRCAMVQDAWSVAAAQRSEREHLLATGRASSSEHVSSPTERSVGSFFLFRESLEQPHSVEVLHVEHSEGTRSGSSLSLSCLEGVLKMETRNAKNRSAKNNTTKNSSLGTSVGLGNME